MSNLLYILELVRARGLSTLLLLVVVAIASFPANSVMGQMTVSGGEPQQHMEHLSLRF